MFMIRQYAACVLMVFTLGALVLAGCGIGYLLKAAGSLFMRALCAPTFRTAKPVAVGSRVGNANLIPGAVGPSAIAIGPP